MSFLKRAVALLAAVGLLASSVRLPAQDTNSPENLFPIQLLDYSGGVNQGLPSTHIGRNEQVDILNFYPWGLKLKKRPGRTKVTQTAGSTVTGLFSYKDDTAGWVLIAGQPTGLAKKDGSGLTALPINDGGSYTSSTAAMWRFRQYKNVGYAVRKSTGAMKRFKSDFMMDAGISAPTAAPTIVDGGAGALTTGNYFAVYTCYNSETDVESNPSPASTVLALGASKLIDWSGISTCLDGQVNARRLYRTLVNQQGQYFFVAQINDNTTTTFADDNVITADMGRSVSFRNDEPPALAHLLEIWKERMWLSDGTDVFFSEAGLMESFYALAVISVYPDDGHEIRALHAWGDRLVIGKTNAIHYIVGSDSTDFSLQTLSDRHGVIAPDSVKSAEGLLFWFEGENFYRAAGNSVVSISDTKVRTFIDNIAATEKSQVVAGIYPRLGLYVAAIPQGTAGGGNEKLLVYNYRSDSWTAFDYPSSTAPKVIGDFYDENFNQLLYAGFGSDGLIYDIVSGTSDDGAAIQGSFRTKDFMALGRGLGLIRVGLLSDRSTGTTSLKLYLDGSDTAFKTRSISLDTGSMWRWFAHGNSQNIAPTLGVQFTHSGTDDFEFSGMVLEGEVFDRFGTVN